MITPLVRKWQAEIQPLRFSFMRLDAIGLCASQVMDRIRELGARGMGENIGFERAVAEALEAREKHPMDDRMALEYALAVQFAEAFRWKN